MSGMSAPAPVGAQPDWTAPRFRCLDRAQVDVGRIRESVAAEDVDRHRPALDYRDPVGLPLRRTPVLDVVGMLPVEPGDELGVEWQSGESEAGLAQVRAGDDTPCCSTALVAVFEASRMDTFEGVNDGG
jgi:hypothetical protein